MQSITLRTTINGLIKHYHLTIAPEQVLQGRDWLPGLRMSDCAYADITAQGVNAELPLYCFHEGCDMGGSFEDDETGEIVGTWAILLDSKPADYAAVESVINAA